MTRTSMALWIGAWTPMVADSAIGLADRYPRCVERVVLVDGTTLPCR